MASSDASSSSPASRGTTRYARVPMPDRFAGRILRTRRGRGDSAPPDPVPAPTPSLCRRQPPRRCDRAALEARIDALGPWLQGPFPLGADLVAAGPWRCDLRWRNLAPALPDVTGARVLDVGCNAGYDAFQLKLRGAAEVLACEPYAFVEQARFLESSTGLEWSSARSAGKRWTRMCTAAFSSCTAAACCSTNPTSRRFSSACGACSPRTGGSSSAPWSSPTQATRSRRGSCPRGATVTDPGGGSRPTTPSTAC